MWTTRLRLAAGAVLFAMSAAPAARDSAPVVYTADIKGIIHPVAADHVRGVLAKADAANAALVVFTLQTPGGLVDSTRDLINSMIHAKTPVAVFVGPSGHRAASAGFLITIAADVAAMAPGTHIGAAHPVAGGGEKIDDKMAEKWASDVAGYARTLASQRKRNVTLVEEGVTKSKSYTETEALGASPPLIDLVATDVADLVKKLDGRTIARFDGRPQTLRLGGYSTRNVEMTWAQRLLSTIAHPQIAYLLLTLGTLGLTIELWNPGAILPGVAGGICLLLAFFAFQVLPVSYAGVLLILFGLVLLILEIKVSSFGLLATGGVVSLFFGSMMLYDAPLPELRLSLSFILPITLGLSAIVLFLVHLGVKAQRAASVTGESGMIGEIGQALVAFGPDGAGSVRAHGEIWTATSGEPIAAGQAVRVTGVKGLVLTVRPEPGPTGIGRAARPEEAS